MVSGNPVHPLKAVGKTKGLVKLPSVFPDGQLTKGAIVSLNKIN